MDGLKSLLGKIPWELFLVLYGIYLAFDLHSFSTSSDSPLNMKRGQVTAMEAANKTLEAKVQEAREFFNSLDITREQIRILATELSEMKNTLSDRINIPEFLKTVDTEAKKLGITVLGLRPLPEVKREFYIEQPYELKFKAVYVQILVFLDRLSNARTVVRVDDYQVKPAAKPRGKYLEISGDLKLRTFTYAGSAEDEIAQKAKNVGQGAPAGGVQPPAGGAPAGGGGK